MWSPSLVRQNKEERSRLIWEGGFIASDPKIIVVAEDSKNMNG